MIRAAGTYILGFLCLVSLPFAVNSFIVFDRNGMDDPVRYVLGVQAVLSFWLLTASFLLAAVGTWRKQRRPSWLLLLPLPPIASLINVEEIHQAIYRNCFLC
jgi:hypothetical protein